MAKYYKLNAEIKQFIVEQKRVNPKLSCRGLSVLIKEHFQVNISKSLINNVIKQGNLSSPVGRRRIKEAIIPKEPQETEIVKPEPEFMENGGFFFLKAADLKLGLTSRVAEALSAYSPNLPKENHQEIIEALICQPFFQHKKSLWLLVGREVAEESLTGYSQELLQVPFLKIKESVAKLSLDTNFNEIKDLWQKCLLRLNAYAVHFFPPEYQFLDFLAMQERFYGLPARIETKTGLLIIQLFYPKGFFGMNDMVWQEGFSYAVKRINEAKIFTLQKAQIWISPQVEFLEGNAFSPP